MVTLHNTLPFIFGSSVIGPLHVKYILPCQDYCGYETLNGIGIIAVADGLGSVLKSHIGSETVVKASIKKAKEIISTNENDKIDLSELSKESFIFARKEIESKANEINCELGDIATTLIVVIISKDKVAVSHIGDGAVVAETDEGLKIISEPGESEYSNIVVPITSDEWQKKMRTTPTLSNIKFVAAFTDGCERAALKKTKDGIEPFEGFLTPIFLYASDASNYKQAVQDIKNLLFSDRLCDNSEDDKTLVIAVCDKE